MLKGKSKRNVIWLKVKSERTGNQAAWRHVVWNNYKNETYSQSSEASGEWVSEGTWCVNLIFGCTVILERLFSFILDQVFSLFLTKCSRTFSHTSWIPDWWNESQYRLSAVYTLSSIASFTSSSVLKRMVRTILSANSHLRNRVAICKLVYTTIVGTNNVLLDVSAQEFECFVRWVNVYKNVKCTMSLTSSILLIRTELLKM